MGQRILDLWETHSAFVMSVSKNLASAAVIIVLGIILSKGVRKLVHKANSSWSESDGTAVPLLQAVIRYAIIIICVIMILNIFGVSTASLIALLGAAGVTIALALKDTLGNVAAGIGLLLHIRPQFLHLGRSFKKLHPKRQTQNGAFHRYRLF